VLCGRIDGDVLVFESAPGRFPRIRLTWEATDPEVVLWRNEMTFDGESWFLVEDYRILPSD
jgi:hypothetical protein